MDTSRKVSHGRSLGFLFCDCGCFGTGICLTLLSLSATSISTPLRRNGGESNMHRIRDGCSGSGGGNDRIGDCRCRLCFSRTVDSSSTDRATFRPIYPHQGWHDNTQHNPAPLGERFDCVVQLTVNCDTTSRNSWPVRAGHTYLGIPSTRTTSVCDLCQTVRPP